MSSLTLNSPALWLADFPFPTENQHKHSRGHCFVAGGDRSTGAAKLAARAALRIGSGLVTILCNQPSFPLYAHDALSLMVKPYDEVSFPHSDSDTLIIGPGFGTSTEHITFSHSLLNFARLVCDADIFTLYQNQPESLFKTIQQTQQCILTPHESEFERLFKNTDIDMNAAREERALHAAKISGAVIILKGHHTIIASPDGRYLINQNAPAYLATAGSGDVLSGICGGLLAQSMNAFEAACAATWIHAEAANYFGIGLISEDLPDIIPVVLNALLLGASGN